MSAGNFALKYARGPSCQPPTAGDGLKVLCRLLAYGLSETVTFGHLGVVRQHHAAEAVEE